MTILQFYAISKWAGIVHAPCCKNFANHFVTQLIWFSYILLNVHRPQNSGGTKPPSYVLWMLAASFFTNISNTQNALILNVLIAVFIWVVVTKKSRCLEKKVMEWCRETSTPRIIGSILLPASFPREGHWFVTVSSKVLYHNRTLLKVIRFHSLFPKKEELTWLSVLSSNALILSFPITHSLMPHLWLMFILTMTSIV